MRSQSGPGQPSKRNEPKQTTRASMPSTSKIDGRSATGQRIVTSPLAQSSTAKHWLSYRIRWETL